ncbi:MAG TPA: CheR family methyltransferase, partial [Verrucomicrobiae bacterium]|nr:CheR family methyltransferase [Verrucomicrobiae bacterium]
TISPELQEKYFKPVQDGRQLSSEIMKRVSFARVNLLELGEISPVARVQAIFCRNVFIYFSHHAIRQTVAMMAVRMPPDSHLFVGASESLLRLTTDFELKEIGDALVYVRI